MYLISVIIPIYNTEKYLDECVNSVLEQTINNIEIILVDDGSPDESGCKCDALARIYDNIKVVHKNNEGLGMARNSGLEVATGEYIAFLDSDDYILRNYLEKMVIACKKADADICVSKGFYSFSNAEKLIENEYFHDYTILSKEDIKKLMPRLISKKANADDGIWGSVCFSLYKHYFIKSNNLKFVSERDLVSEDIWFSLDAFDKASVVVLENIMGYCYRYNANSLSRSYRKNRFQQITNFVIQLKEKCRELGLDDYEQRIAMYYWVNFEKCINQEIRFKNRKESIKNLKVMRDDFVCDMYLAILIGSNGLKGLHALLCKVMV